MSASAYPKPFAYYQSPLFEGRRAELHAPDADLSRISLSGGDEAQRARILQQLQLTKFRRLGRLRGEYAVLAGGLLALDRDGAPIKLNCDADDDWAHSSVFSQLENQCAAPDFEIIRQHVVNNWDALPSIGETQFLAEPYSVKNYYHFSMVFLPKLRHLAEGATVAIPQNYLNYPFQRELIGMTFGDRDILPTPDIFRVTDPVLRYEPFGNENVRWLREKVQKRARRGERLIYVARRSTMVGRSHGSILEDADFMHFLERHGFETIDFGSGEIPVSQQIEMLSGARVVLSAHGANLTNIAYAEEGVSVVEVLPFYWAYFSHMHIAAAAGLNYFGLLATEIDAERRLKPDMALLSRSLEAALDASISAQAA
jgi:hypothetical protein